MKEKVILTIRERRKKIKKNIKENICEKASHAKREKRVLNY
jgi:hypothetical protein